MKACERGTFQNGIQKGKGLDHGVEPPHKKHFLLKLDHWIMQLKSSYGQNLHGFW